MRPHLIACLLALWPGTGVAANLAYLDLGPGANACCLVPDGSGNTYVIAASSSPNGTDISVTKLDSANRVTSTFTFGGGSTDQPRAAALDSQGNLVIAGQTSSADFPLVHPVISQTETGAPAGFVAKVNPTTGEILFSTRIGGTAAESFVRTGTVVNAVAVDPAGNIYAGGSTNASDFPTTAGAFQKSGAGGNTFGVRPYGFVLKLPPAGDRFVYSTLLGGATANCVGGSHCIGKYASTSVNALVVDAAGNVTAAGNTNAPDFPTTSGAFQTVCHCQEYANNGFVSQLNPDGSALAFSTFLGGSWYGDVQVPAGTNVVAALARDSAGNIYAAGRTDAADFPTTTAALQPAFAGPSSGYPRPTDGFLTKLNPTGTALAFSTYLGGTAADRINALDLDSSSNVWVTGLTGSTTTFFDEVSADGTHLLTAQPAPAGAAGQAIRTAGANLTILGTTGSVLQLAAAPLTGPAVLGIANSAGATVKGYVAPGEFVSLYGVNLSGAQVTFDGTAAPLLYTGDGQINALVPYAIAGSSTVTMQVNGGPSVELYVRPAQPEVFNVAGAALALNQDGTVNSSQNPAAPGTIVSIFASGAGLLSNRPADGSVPTTITSTPIQPVTILLNNRSLEVLYAGNSPGLVVNLLQVNFRLPQQSATGQYQLQIGGYTSASFSLAVQ